MRKIKHLVLGEIITFLFFIVTAKLFWMGSFPVHEEFVILCLVIIGGMMIMCTYIILDKLEEIISDINKLKDK
ncbi:hypothetical protein [Clostridium senegalense]|uniref:Uncharacterized protein n=1 Tax=Clostridium senegalense TaxID=1465809 RepID=A0A6M0GYX8_9CLOT|nr:hypothetical protein [Clostridium senegalense]NEU03529.1 hypothetical protein [Clostridium senegalense]